MLKTIPAKAETVAGELEKSHTMENSAKKKNNNNKINKAKVSQLLDLLPEVAPWGHYHKVTAPTLAFTDASDVGDKLLSPDIPPRCHFLGCQVATQGAQSHGIPMPPAACPNTTPLLCAPSGGGPNAMSHITPFVTLLLVPSKQQ